MIPAFLFEVLNYELGVAQKVAQTRKIIEILNTEIWCFGVKVAQKVAQPQKSGQGKWIKSGE